MRTRTIKPARQEARVKGDLTFTIDIACRAGHWSPRYVSTGRCVACTAQDSTTTNARARQKAQYRRNSDLKTKSSRDWKAKNPRRVLAYRIKQYGLTLEQYDAIVATQDGKCPICLEDLMGGRYQTVDHCHETGRVRGVLCSRCNSALGLLRDRADAATRAAAYLAQDF